MVRKTPSKLRLRREIAFTRLLGELSVILYKSDHVSSSTSSDIRCPFTNGREKKNTKMSKDEDREEILDLTQRLLMAVTSGDWESYEQLCDPSITSFEPEAMGNLVDGLDFHHFYFKLGDGESTPVQSTIVAPHIRVMGDVAVIAYVRLTQKIGDDGKPITSAMEESRVWERQKGVWRHVHFHRSSAH